jgi:hypothetical protein
MLIYRGKMNWDDYADNEEFTVILPFGTSRLDDPIHLYWQWTKAATGATKLNVLARTTITSAIQTAVKGEAGFSCVHDDYYTFDITSKQSGEQLSVYMRNPKGYTSAEMVLQRFSPSRVLPDSAFPMSPERPIPRIYAGKLNWFDYAVNELFLVVLPDGLGRSYPATAHWQWTVLDNKVEKLNCDADDRQHYSESDHQDANTFYFTQGGYYTLECTADDTAQTLTVTVKNPAGDSQSTTLHLQQIINASGDADGMRRTRALWDYSATIHNDTSDLVICTFSPSASAAGGRVLAVGGFGIATIGFVPLLATQLPTPWGWAIAIVGAGIAALGVVDMLLVPKDPNTRPLFPGDAACNTSSGGGLFSCNNIVVIRAYIDNATQLVIRNGTAADVSRDVSWSLEDDSSNELTWSDFFRITLPRPHHITTFRAIKIKCLKPSWEGDVVSDSGSRSPDMDQYTLSIGAKNSEVRRYSTVVEGKKYGGVLFDCVTPDYVFVVTQGFGPNRPVSNSVGDYRLAPLQNGMVLVQIMDAKIRTLFGGPLGVKVKTCASEAELHDEIKANPGFFAYEWTIGWADKELKCWPQSLDIQVVRDESYARCIYFAVPGIDVMTAQFMLEDS